MECRITLRSIMEQDNWSDYSNKAIKLNVLDQAKNVIHTQILYMILQLFHCDSITHC